MNSEQLQIRHIQTYTTYYEYKRRERRIAFKKGETRKVSVVIYINPPTENTTANINFSITDYGGNTISQNLLENVVFEQNKASIILDMNVSGYEEGIYRVNVSIRSCAATSAIFIIGEPERIKAVMTPKNNELCAQIANNLCQYYEPCSNTVYPIINNNYSVLKKEQSVRKHLGIPADMQIYIFADATITNSGKKGIAVCRNGIYLHNGVFLSWYQFLLTDIHIIGPLSLGEHSVYVYTAEADTFADLLGFLQREIIERINLNN